MCARLVAQQLFVTWHHTRLAFIFYKYFSDLVFLELEKSYLSRPIYISHVWRYYINAPPTWHTNKGCVGFTDFNLFYDLEFFKEFSTHNLINLYNMPNK